MPVAAGCQVETDRTLAGVSVPDVLTTEVHGFAWGRKLLLATPRGLLIIDDKTFTTRRLTTRRDCRATGSAVAWLE